uniref:CD109 antigen n=1 Tax=Lygus hesperus TaxID=30085 RepID=A0A0A9X780_LYGHE
MMGRPLMLAILFTIVVAPRPPCHVITGGRSVRPGQLYVVAVHLCSEGVLKVTSSIVRSGVVVSSATLDVPFGAVSQIPLKVPTGISSGNYKLVVEGALKGTNKYFYNSTSLEFKPKLAAIIVQTSRPIYRASQTVYFRVLALQTDLKAYDDTLDVYIIDSDGFIMRRWLSVFTNNGILSMKYKLPEYVKEGVWKIRVKTYIQVEEQNIKVENYFDPFFEMFVDMPAYASLGDVELTASVKGMMTTQELVRGNLTMRLLLMRKSQDEQKVLWEKKTFANGPVEQKINLSDIGGERGDLKLEAEMTDLLYGSSARGYAVTRVVPDKLRIRFVCDGIITFRLAKPIVLSIAVESESGHAVVPGTIEKSQLLVEVETTTKDGSLEKQGPIELFPADLLNQTNDLFFIDADALDDFPRTGVITVTLRPSQSTTFLRIRAILRVDGFEIDASALCTSVDSPDANIALYATSLYPQVDEFAVLHLTADVPILSFQYLVISKDNIVNGGEGFLPSGLRPTASFSVAMGPDMAPGFHVVAFATYNGSLLADSIFLPVNAFNRWN